MEDVKSRPLLQTQKTVDENSRRCALSRRILSVLSIQTVLALVITSLIQYVEKVQDFFDQGIASLLYYISLAVLLTVALFVLCARELSKKKVFGGILLFFHTVSVIFIIGYLARDNPEDWFPYILQVAVVTFILNLYSCLTKTDYTLYGAGLYVILSVAIVFTAAYYTYNPKNELLLSMIKAAIAVLIYALYVIFEIQLITSGKRYDIGENDHVIGSMLIYADILYLGLLVIDLITNIND